MPGSCDANEAGGPNARRVDGCAASGRVECRAAASQPEPTKLGRVSTALPICADESILIAHRLRQSRALRRGDSSSTRRAANRGG